MVTTRVQFLSDYHHKAGTQIPRALTVQQNGHLGRLHSLLRLRWPSAIKTAFAGPQALQTPCSNLNLDRAGDDLALKRIMATEDRRSRDSSVPMLAYVLDGLEERAPLATTGPLRAALEPESNTE